MERDQLISPQERELSSSELGTIYDKAALVAVDNGKRFSIPESVQLAGYFRPTMFICEFATDQARRIFLSSEEEAMLCDEEAYMVFSTPHAYDEADADNTHDSSVYIVFRAQIRGTDITVEKTYDIICRDFMGSNGDFTGRYHQEGRAWSPREAPSLEDGLEALVTDDQREMNVHDFGAIMRLLETAKKS